MKKISVLAAFFCLLFATSAIFAQNKATNFAGSWELDVAKSKLPERSRIESMTLNVTQNDKELKVETMTKRAPRPEGEMSNNGNGALPQPPDANRGTGQGGGMGRGAATGGGSGMVTYNLDGKETNLGKVSSDGKPTASVRLKAETEKGGKLKLTSSRSMDTPNGSMSFKTTDSWELLDDGKTLKVTRDSETPRGTQTSEMYFTKTFSSQNGTYQMSDVTGSDKGTIDMKGVSGSKVTSTRDNSLSGGNAMPKQISAGVLNGKAVKLVLPAYPPAARAVKASGAVNVQVTIDELGNVISASAVSGHPLLRAAAVEAARNSSFSPTLLEGIPVKVRGSIVYTFAP